MEFEKLVRGEPGQYVASQGALKELPARLSLFQRPVIVTGQVAYAAFVKHYGKEADWSVLFYDRTASHEDMDRLADRARQLGADVIVGIGGGKVMDTSKGVADRLNVELVLVPTLVATCACSTPLLVAYYPDHSFKSIDYCQRSGFMTVVDYDLLIDAPKEYLISGISDTLAKWYELEAIHRGKKRQELPAMVQLALATAQVSQDILLHDTEAVLDAADRKQVTPAFERMVDTVYAVAANVGCQTSDYVSGAHALHNGLTVLHETHEIAHGLKVAYGILVQLCLTGDEDEVRKLLPFYQKNGYIYRWDQLGVTEDRLTAMQKVAEKATVPTESYVNIRADITANEVVAAMLRLEEVVEAAHG
ncbi:iron-containing alcohol dehydrogenase family protein [Streptococcus suis]|uniref:Iron-containing alcohol dehydrogenase family protein n=1 Tax=Streptococcus suivaginalis TaxID=3028082 RepID=A0AA96ZZV8_9STRE|nr:iron-containing alcohol dehydrogenase family protein [Streptococcus sp. 29896]MCK4027173.1 iron-containing alcohol dehydrogenase family protein [Streptococcus suis]WNY46729.1 iron-containing alcohol dehydrogenase family protein [Streptococcus sp. 29896]